MKRLVALLPLVAFAAAAPVPIFDGRTLDRWEGNAKMWRVENGMLTGGSLAEKVPHNDFIATLKSYANFELRVTLKLSGDPATGFINSGVQIRSLRVPGSHEMSGYQVDYGVGWYGKLYDESRRNRVVAESADMKAATAAIREADWNEYRIRAEGARIRSWINGAPALDYTEPDPGIAQNGRIGIQIHAGGKALVQVKDVTIEELPPTPNAPTWEKVGKPDAKKAADAKPMKEGNVTNAIAKSPEDERACFTLPDDFEVELVAAESEGIGKFVPLAFDQHGALWTTTAFEYPVDGNENPAAADALYTSRAKDKVLVFDRDSRSPTGLAKKPRVFADGLAIPLGVLPYKNGCYVQHGHDIVFLEDTDGDGRADKRTVILTGFGVQDSHLFPHQFLRAPGGWIWMAQGAFNYGKVAQPGDEEHAVQFDQTRMAKFRPDGSQFTITSNGPCNIWGLVLNGEGEAFIQEANDFGYPVMPFHEFANYPGCSDRQWKSYAPEFPGTAPDFRMGGTGLSGLALLDELWARLLEGDTGVPAVRQTLTAGTAVSHSQTVLVANPITNRIQAIKMHRDGPRWRLDPPRDFLVSEDPWFRPVAITIGPDGCLYIVDWYNKIISHNEVPRNHPDRDKIRGRIWRVKAKAQQPFDVPDFTTLPGDALISKLGGPSLAQSHLAWQAIVDREMEELAPRLQEVASRKEMGPSRRIAAVWALDDLYLLDSTTGEKLLNDTNRNIRREGVERIGSVCIVPGYTLGLTAPFSDDPDPEVRCAAIKVAASIYELAASGDWGYPQASAVAAKRMLEFVQSPRAEPVAPSTRNGKPIKVREAYDREFERYLVRMFLERHPDAVAKFLDSDAAKDLPLEARLLATLALEPRSSAARVAKLLPALERAPGQEEVLRLAQFPDEPGVGEALRAILSSPLPRRSALEALLATRPRLDSTKLRPLLTDPAKQLLAAKDDSAVDLGIQLAGAFQLDAAEPQLVALLESGTAPPAVGLLRALSQIGSVHSELFARLATTARDPQLRDEALLALVSSKASDASERLLQLWPDLSTAQRRSALDRLASTKSGAKTIVTAIRGGAMKKDELDGPTVEKLQAVLGDDPDLAALLGELASLFRPVLVLDGSEEAWTETGVTLDGPFTVECWVQLAPGIGNADGILGTPGQLDMNFFQEKFRVWVGGAIHDAIVSKKPITAELWTHVAATRDAQGMFRLYQDGELVADESKQVTAKFENVRIGWTGAKGGTAGALSEFRIWNGARSADEIRRDFDRIVAATPSSQEVPAAPRRSFGSRGGGAAAAWGKLQRGAKIAKTSDFPPVMSAAEAAALDEKFAKIRALAEKPGDAARGRNVAAVCQACHLFKGQGASIGPDLSGIGAMGIEAILRNIITPNAAMENGYRIYRVELKSGDLVDSFFVSEDKDAVVVRQPGVPDRRIAKTDIRGTKFLRRSLMPEGLLDALPAEQVSDLFAFLKKMK